MKRTKRLATFMLVAMLTAGGAALAGCDKKHTHTYSDDWEKDSTGHWHVATCDDLEAGDDDYKKDYAAHEWGGDDECDVCHYVKASTEYTVTLDANGGTLEGDKETAEATTKNGKLEKLPAPAAPEGMEFVGWFTEDNGGEKVTTETAFTANSTIYAQYVMVYTITLNAGEGTLSTTALKAKDGKITELPAPKAPAGKQFVGWFTTSADTEEATGEEVTVETEFDKDTTIYARYSSVYTVTLNVGNGGTLPEGVSATLTTKGGRLESLPTPVTQNAMVFIGWFTAESGGEEVTVDTVFTGEEQAITIYARYAQEISVTLNVGEGTLPAGASSTMITTENKLPELPLPVVPENKWFKGWFTAETDGVLVTETTDLSEYVNNENAVTLYARYVAEVTVTLNPGTAGTLPEGAITTYKTVNGKIQLPEGQRGLPAVISDKEHWVFFGWYNGNSAVNVETTVFDSDAELTAKVGRENGVWVGETFIHSLTLNNGAYRTEYWLSGDKITLKKGDVMSLYISGNVIRHYVEPASAGIEKPAASAQVTSVNVTVAGEFAIYLHLNATDWSCEYSGPTEINTGSEVPYGCDAFTITIGSNAPITFFLKDASGNGVGKADFSKFCIYTYQEEIFGNWNGSTTNGKLKDEITVTNTAIPSGWIFRWGSGYGQQTANIIGAFKAGKTYLVELKGHQKEAVITELAITSVYTITLDLNYEGQPEVKETAKAYNGKLSYMPSFVREGFEDKDIFWYTAAEGGEKVTTDTVFTADTTIYARWSDKIVMTVDQNYEGKTENKTQTLNYGKLSAFPVADTRADYDFVGWFTAAEGGEQVTLATVFEVNSTIYAQWKQKIVITVDQNYEGKPDNATLKLNNGKFKTLPAQDVREDYDFVGWFTAAEGGEQVTLATVFEENITIYAQWKLKIVITVDQNYEGKTENTMVKANNGKISPLPANDVREDYDFVGWFTEAEGGTRVTATTVFTENTTVYAQWKLKFVITLDQNYEGKPENTTVKTTNDYLSEIPAVESREGLEFVGWFTEPEGGTLIKTTTRFTQDTTIYGQWRVPFKVTFNYNYEGCAEPTVVTANVVSGQTYSKVPALPENPVREGYNFVGWYTVSATTGGSRFYVTSSVNEDKTVYARWQVISQVTFNYNYEGAPASVTVATTQFFQIPLASFPADPAREELEFVGWFTAQEGGDEVDQYYKFPANATIYARWRTPLVITFDLNYEGQPDTKITLKTVGRGKLGTFPEPPVREGYVFYYWSTTVAVGGNIVSNTSRTYTEDTTLYAHWKEPATITFDLNYEGQPETKETAKTVNGNVITALPETPVREGFTFLGWFSAAEGGTEITIEKKYTKDTVVYAQWAPVEQETQEEA